MARTLGLLTCVAILLVSGATTVRPGPASAQPDPVAAMRGIPVRPPVPAPDITFQTLDGQPARLDVFRGRPVVLTFFTTW